MVKIKDNLAMLFNIIFAGVFFYLLILAVGKMNLSSPISALLIAPVLYFVYRLCKRDSAADEYDYEKIWRVLWCVSIAMMLVILYMTEVNRSWDWGQLIISAYGYVQTGELNETPEYFMKFQNNQFWLVVLIYVFDIISKIFPSLDYEGYKIASSLISCAFVQLTILFIYKTAKLLWSERKAFYVGLAALMYAPFYLYAQFMYTDTSGGLAAAVMFYYFVKMFQENRDKAVFGKGIVYAVIVGCVGAAATKIKLIVFILYVAIVIAFFIRERFNAASMIRGGGIANMLCMHIYAADGRSRL